MWKYHFWSHVKLFFEIKIPDQIFKTPIGKWILVQEMNCIYENTRGFKCVFVSSYKKTLLRRWIMLGRKHDWMRNSLFHWSLGKEVQQQRSYANMNTSMITHKGAKHLVIIDWNFWNLSIIHSPRQRASLQQSIEVICRSFST